MPNFSLFVATTGNEDNPGVEAQLFAKLKRARQAVRELKANARPGHPVTVWIHGGVNECSEPFLVNRINCGTEQYPIVCSAYPGEKPLLSAGSNWQEFILPEPLHTTRSRPYSQ